MIINNKRVNGIANQVDILIFFNYNWCESEFAGFRDKCIDLGFAHQLRKEREKNEETQTKKRRWHRLNASFMDPKALYKLQVVTHL